MKRRLVSGIIALILSLSVIFGSNTVFAETATTDDGMIEPGFSSDETYGYREYYEKYKSANKPDGEALINIGDATEGTAVIKQTGGTDALVFEKGTETVTLPFRTDAEGIYELELTYCGLEGNSGNIEMILSIDGKIPFDEAAQIAFPRLYRDETSDLKQDVIGNDIRSSQTEISEWITDSFHDSQGLFAGNYIFGLAAGEHTITLKAVKEPFAIKGLRFYNPEATPSYSEYSKTVPSKEISGECKVYEAEKTYSKTSTMLYPVSDRSDCATTPSSPIAKKLNTIGGENWNTPNQRISWQIEAPDDGLYKISFRYKQNYLRGMYVSRTMLIDDELKFEELRELHFDYGIDWQQKVVGDDEPYEIYLEKGVHTLTLIPTVGSLSEYISEVSESVMRLNTLYRKIIMVTGTNPDTYRDYYLQDSIPGLTDDMQELSESLSGVEKSIEKLTGNKGTQAAALGRMADQLTSFAEAPNTIPSRLTTFRDNVVSISSWVLEVKNQSLMLDKFCVCPTSEDFVNSEASFFQNLLYHIKAFFGSFVTDYETVGKTQDNKKQICVWISSGRDQAEVLKELIDNEFTAKTGIGVQLSLAQSGLMQAIMARKAPDVALMVGRGDPVNYALRGAVLPLEDLDGFDELTDGYMSETMVPYYYGGHCYALPNSQNFFMLFYRTDVFSELSLSAPQTWDDMLFAVETLQRNNMNVGFPYTSLDAYSVISQGVGGTSLFPTLLLQKGIGLYNDELTKTTLNTESALSAFKEWCGYYTQYGFPLYKDDFNRFRTGEMPLVITNYTFYSQLSTAAPEINNLWKMTLIPGTQRADGTIDRSSAGSGSAGIILSTTEDRDSSWEFLKWWNSSEVQGKYGIEIENVLGPAGRYNPANYDAIKYLGWSSDELELIMQQWKNVKEMPEIAGSYYVSRNIDNAFKEVFYDNSNAREALNYWNKQINDELERKREEFGTEGEAAR